MPVSNSQAQGLVLALFGASAGGHLTSLAAASNLNTLAGDLTMSAGLILGRDLSSNTAFRDHVTGNLKLTGDALTAANAWLDGQLNAGAARGDIIATAVTFLSTLTDTTSPFYASAQAFQSTVAAAVTWSTGAGATTFGVSALRAQQGNVDVVAGSSFVLTTATAPDLLIGTAGNDTFTGDALSFNNNDRVVDSSKTDSDTYNLTVSAAATPDVSGVENINVSMNAVSALVLDGSKIIGAQTLNIARGDLSIGGTTVRGNKAAAVKDLSATNVPKVVAAAGVTSLSVDTATTAAGLNIDASVVTGNVVSKGAATINAGVSAGTVVVQGVGNTTQDAKPVSINADLAAVVVVGATYDINADSNNTTDTDAGDNDFGENGAATTGAVTINAAKATTVTVGGATGGVTINAGTTATGDVTITAVNVDDSGATIVTGSGSTLAAEKEIDIVIDGTDKVTDAASISAAGTIDLDIDGSSAGNVDILTLSGNGAAVTYRLAAPNTGTFVSMTKAGTQSVTVSGDLSEFSATTIDGINTITINAGGGAALDASKWTNVGNVNIGVNNSNSAITVNPGTKWTITAATQTTGLDFDFATGSTNGDLYVVSGDVNGSTNSAVGTATVAAFNAAAPSATIVGNVTLEANESNFEATSTVLGAKQNLIVTGDEDVTLGAVTADSVNASDSTGIITLTMAANVDTVTTGSGADAITLDGALKHTLATGSGIDAITITDTEDNSFVDAGEGDDTIAVDKLGKVYVVNGGAGDDVFTLTLDGSTAMAAVIVGGDGSADKVVLDYVGANALNSNSAFGLAGVEQLDITLTNDTTTLSAAQFASNSALTIIAGGTADTFHVTGSSSTSAVTIDASALKLSSGSAATIQYTGSTRADTITGGREAELFVTSRGADSIEGGLGNDTLVLTSDLQETGSTEAASGYIVNLSGTSISATAVFAGTGKYLGEGVAQVGSGQVASAYASADSSTVNNSAVITSVSGIENVTGSTGADYIAVADVTTTITGGAGDDYIRLGGGTDTVVFSATNGSDTIASFVVGASGDKLNFEAFLTTASTTVDLNGGTTPAITEYTTSSAATNDITNKIALFSNASAMTATSLLAEFAANSGTTAAFAEETTKAVVITGHSSGNALVWYVNAANGGTSTTLVDSVLDIVLVGTITSIDLTAMTVANFVVA